MDRKTFVQGQVLAQISPRARAEQEEDHQERGVDPENFWAVERMEVEKESDADGSSEDRYTDDMESADDDGIDGEEARDEQGEEMDEGEDSEDEDYEGEDDEEEGIRVLKDGGEE